MNGISVVCRHKCDTNGNKTSARINVMKINSKTSCSTRRKIVTFVPTLYGCVSKKIFFVRLWSEKMESEKCVSEAVSVAEPVGEVVGVGEAAGVSVGVGVSEAAGVSVSGAAGVSVSEAVGVGEAAGVSVGVSEAAGVSKPQRRQFSGAPKFKRKSDEELTDEEEEKAEAKRMKRAFGIGERVVVPTVNFDDPEVVWLARCLHCLSPGKNMFDLFAKNVDLDVSLARFLLKRHVAAYRTTEPDDNESNNLIFVVTHVGGTRPHKVPGKPEDVTTDDAIAVAQSYILFFKTHYQDLQHRAISALVVDICSQDNDMTAAVMQELLRMPPSDFGANASTAVHFNNLIRDFRSAAAAALTALKTIVDKGGRGSKQAAGKLRDPFHPVNCDVNTANQIATSKVTGMVIDAARDSLRATATNAFTAAANARATATQAVGAVDVVDATFLDASTKLRAAVADTPADQRATVDSAIATTTAAISAAVTAAKRAVDDAECAIKAACTAVTTAHAKGCVVTFSSPSHITPIIILDSEDDEDDDEDDTAEDEDDDEDTVHL